MSKPVRFTLTWTWGGAVTVESKRDSLLIDSLKRSGFTGIEGARIVCVFKGKVVIPEFSIQYLGIKNGDKIVVCAKKDQTRDRSKRFLESLKPTKKVAQQVVVSPDITEVAARLEHARINDLAFSSWEAMPDYPLVMNDLLKSQEEQHVEVVADDEIEITDITPATHINEDPLPNIFKYSQSSAHGMVKTEYGYNPKNCLAVTYT